MKKIILKNIILELLNKDQELTVAVSGGIDSITLATYTNKLAKKPLNVAHAVSPAVPKEATKRVKQLALKFNWNLHIINANELGDPRYKANPYNRCFFCKENLYNTIKSCINGIILSGANIDDLSDFRPGLDAAKNANVIHPFINADFSKNHIRNLANEIGLELFSDLPSSPCLASRIETGTEITKSLLNNIEIIEKNIHKYIPNCDVRCRWLNNKVNIQFKYPNISNITSKQKDKIVRDVISIFSLTKDRIKFSEYKRGSAFIPRQIGN